MKQKTLADSPRRILAEGFCDYRRLRLNNLTSDKFRHLFYLLYWPVYGLLFAFVEQSERAWHIVYSPLDDLIPFCEWFVLPYMFWFIFLCGMLGYTLLFDIPAFRKMMLFIIFTYSATILIYLIWPTAQELRPDIDALGRDNILTRFMADFYDFDTNTNVCPSLHVIGSVAVLYASWHCKLFRTLPWQLFYWVTTILICASTVFLKQHSVLDIPPALVLCIIAVPLATYGEGWLKQVRKSCKRRTIEKTE